MRNLPFSEPSEELKALRSAYKEESEAERLDFNNRMQEKPLSERTQIGVTLYPLYLGEIRFFLGNSWKLELESKQPFPKYHSFSPGTPVSLFRGEERFYCQVSQLSEAKITLILDGETPDWEPESSVGIDLFYSEKSFREGDKALAQILEAKGELRQIRDKLLGYSPLPKTESKNFSQNKHSLTEITDQNQNQNQKSVLENLNPSQRNAISSIVSTEDFVIVQGPPGTGKTSVLVEAIVELVSRGDRVLVSTPTNSALDLILSKCIQRGLNPVRLGQTGRVSEDLLKYTLVGKIDSHSDSKQIRKLEKEAANLKRSATRYVRNFGKKQAEERKESWADYRGVMEAIKNTERHMEKEILRNSNPVLATNVSAASPSISKEVFDILILDEATQALEPLAWIPIQKAKKIVLAGDENQLPPTVLTNNPVLMETLFIKSIHSAKDTDKLCFLDTQYRMKEEILGFSNQKFYGSKVVTDPSIQHREILGGDEFASPVVFFDTAGTGYEEEKSLDSESIKNPGEAELIGKFLEQYWGRLNLDQSQLGIICPYKEQVFCIKEFLSKWNMNTPGLDSIDPNKWEIATVDSFQGREKEIIILSMTRSNELGELGFLKDYRRMNVSLTRAKNLLVVFGDSSTLIHDSFYADFVDYLQTRGDYKSAYELL
jgi:superfamily I DNA and/or RNA helicase